MSRILRLALIALLGFGFARTSAAQEASAHAAAEAYLKPAVQHAVVLDDTLMHFRTELRPNGRFDIDDKVLRAEYDVKTRLSRRMAPEAAARAYLVESAAKFGISRPTEELVVTSITRGHRSSHVTLQQVFQGIPVYNRETKVNLDEDGQPTMVVNGFAPHLSESTRLRTTPGISSDGAVARVRTSGRVALVTTTPELVVYPSKPARLAWMMVAWPETGTVEWEVLVDAHTGEIIHMLDLSPHAHGPASPGKFTKPTSAHAHRPKEPGKLTTSASTGRPAAPNASATAAVDGTGMVFDPDPMTTAGVPYGAPYVDANDSDIPELNAERIQVTLRDITEGADGMYRLEGPYVIIDGGTRGDAYDVPVESSPDAFQYTRANDYFEAVMAYYHVDKSQRYVQSLDVGFDINNQPVRVNPQAYASDDSEFRPANNILLFGTGGIDDAEDADVIWHEYAHVLLNFTASGLLRTFEGQALHEGWADYWAASYSRFLSEEDPSIAPHDWWRVFTWDGNFGTWCGRPLDHPGHYPDDTDYDATTGCSGFGAKYEYGMLWGTTLMEIYDDLGRTIIDRLNLASHAYLSSSSTFPDAAQAIIQADEDLYGGIHSNIMIARFGARGYVDPAAYGPVLSHEPLPATEDLSGEVRIEVSAVGTTAAVDSVFVFYGTETSASNRIVLDPQGGDLYAGELPLPAEPGVVHYYVEAVDEAGRRRRLPAEAPAETYTFVVGPDAVPPTIAHEAPLNVSVIGWPMDLYVEVSDNLGVDTVWVEYEIRSVEGETQVEGEFGLEDVGDAHFGTFPVTGHKVREGEAISYRIFARDVSRGGNVAVSPAEGFYHVSIIEQGVLRAYDFEGLGQGLQGSGLWSRGQPAFGLRVAHSGSHVWATNPEGAYPGSPQSSTLHLPAVDLSGIGSSYLVFWHWYDFEHNGQAQPDGSGSNVGIWDGGNVKVSTDGGITWSVAQPEGGYTGTISNQYENPLAGQAGFGGYSYGWRREIVPLPAEADVRIRFEFGSDNENRDVSLFFAGWYIDDVSITTSYPEDGIPPVATALPDARSVLVPGQDGTPNISVEVTDDTGIEAVISNYRILTPAGDETGSLRLAMSTTDRDVYAGSVVPSHTFSPGDRIEYVLVVRDFNGNETTYPTSGEAFVIDYRASQESNALTDVVSTGTWRRQGNTWVSTSAADDSPVSSLVLAPFTLPLNSETATFALEHRYDLEAGAGGNVKISDDDGRTWTLLEPSGGYPSTFSTSGSHPMQGEGVFSGTSDGTTINVFDLSAFGGRKIRLRLDFSSGGAAELGAGWFVQKATYGALSPDEEFETTFTLDLQANFPDPFADRTTIAYSIPSRTPVRVSVYDMLGRRVAVVRHVEQEAGNYTMQFDGSGLANGVYMLYLETTMGTKTERMVVAR